MPGFSFPSTGPLGLGSPPYRLSFCFSRRYYDPLRLPLLLLGSLRIPLASQYLAFVRYGSCPLSGLPSGSNEIRTAPGLFSIPVRLFRWSPQGDGGPLKFPGYPYEYMPRSQTPVVSPRLAITSQGLVPSGASKPSAFPGSRPVILSDHDYTIFGAQSRSLLSRYTWLHTYPLGYACRFATALPAILCWWELHGFPLSPTG